MFRHPRSRVQLLAGPMIAGLAAAGLVLARLFASGDPFDHVWAEDGKVFLANGDRLSSLVETYAGYALTLPRILALLGNPLPVPYWAPYAVLAASLVVGALAAFVFAAARAVTGSRAAAVVAAAALPLTPALMLETLGSLANLQWFLLPAALWALLLPAARMPMTALAVGGIAAATTPLAVLLLPAALLVHRWDFLRHRAVQGVLVGSLVQLVLMLFGRSTEGGPDRRPGLPANIVTTFLSHFGGTEVAPVGLAWAAVCATGLALVVGVAHSGPFRLHVVAAAGSGLLLLAATTVMSGDMASRYVGAASMLLFAGVAIAVGTTRWVLPGVAVLAVTAVVAFPAHAIKFSGPSWSEAVAAWSQTCAAGAESAAIPVGPGIWGAATVTCPRGD